MVKKLRWKTCNVTLLYFTLLYFTLVWLYGCMVVWLYGCMVVCWSIVCIRQINNIILLYKMMPYIIRKSKAKSKRGYKVCKKNNTRKCFSKKPLSLKRAKKQMKAIIISEINRNKQ